VAATEPLFSVILPTRNRPGLFAAALASVRAQHFANVEILVVNDGSSPEHVAAYRAVLDAAPDDVRAFDLIPRPRGHGHSYALNFGADQARGRYLCFLDDDDVWTDPAHLSRATGVIAHAPEPPALLLANQKAYRNGEPVDREVWIEDLEHRLNRPPDESGAYTVTVAELLQCSAYCHLNTLIVSRALFAEIGGFDEGIRYENDRDIYLRAIDRAGLIMFLPDFVSRHNIPDPARRESLSTSEPELSKRLYQLRVFDKTALFATRPELRAYALRQRSYVLDHIAHAAGQSGRHDCARTYAMQSLVAKIALRLRPAGKRRPYGAR
jgi:glycosyltransferase involved in cell wall biosynthesis